MDVILELTQDDVTYVVYDEQQFSLWLVWIPSEERFDYHEEEPDAIANRTVTDRSGGPH